MLTDTIWIDSPASKKLSNVVFFVTGNPGLISYYDRFLRSLHERANAIDSERGVAVYGRSLHGFELDGSARLGRVFSLQEQIDFVQSALGSVIARLKHGHKAEKVSITLCGHSVGAYIVLQLLERYLATRNNVPYRIAAGVLLFPTVVDIAQSASGSRVKWPLMMPGFPVAGGYLASWLLHTIPVAWLRALVSRLPAFQNAPDESERWQARETTIAFLKSPLGVRQTICMAADEMREITFDKFRTEIWGSTRSSLADKGAAKDDERPPAKLFFYFGSNDHWVADHTRNSLIAARAFEPATTVQDRSDWIQDSRPWMEIDDTGISHSFCIGKPLAHIIAVVDGMPQAVDHKPLTQSIGDSDAIALRVSEYLKVVLQ